MTPKEKIFIILAGVALVTVVLTRQQHGLTATMSHAGIAENEEMTVNADDLIVGDSNPGEACPSGRPALANTPWQRGMGFYPSLRSTTRQPRVHTQHNNKTGVTPLEVVTSAAVISGV